MCSYHLVFFLLPPLKVTFVTFDGEEVVGVQEYTGGVAGEAQPPLQLDPR